ncbi:MAG: hypothetical protein VYC82_05160, partial [Verrucomicrobiota bacterium]|nr:hypothetical protein [Verrucomicrobiota bacterium]
MHPVPAKPGDHRSGIAAVSAEQLTEDLVEALGRRTEIFYIHRAENPHRPSAVFQPAKEIRISINGYMRRIRATPAPSCPVSQGQLLICS